MDGESVDYRIYSYSPDGTGLAAIGDDAYNWDDYVSLSIGSCDPLNPGIVCSIVPEPSTLLLSGLSALALLRRKR